MGLHSVSSDITTDASGDATVYAGLKTACQVIAVKYEPTTIETGATVTITTETSAQTILSKASAGTATVWFYPVVKFNLNTDGSALASYLRIQANAERIKIVIASGGNAKTGTVTIYTTA